MKCLVILAVLFAVAQASVETTGKAPDNNSHANRHPKATTNGNESPTSPPLTTEDHSADKQSILAVAESAPAMWRKREWVTFWANLALAGVGIGGIIAAFVTLKKLERQTKATEIAAKSAETSATAAMGVAVPTLMLHEFVFMLKPFESPDEFFRNSQVAIAVKNFGQTPAFLKSYSVAFTNEKLPDAPIYPFPYPCDVEDVVDAGRPRVLGGEPMRAFGFTSEEDVHALIAGNKTLIVYGYVCYGDLFGSPLRYMKFSKELLHIDWEKKTTMVMDRGGYKYTGQHENYDPPSTLPLPKG